MNLSITSRSFLKPGTFMLTAARALEAADPTAKVSLLQLTFAFPKPVLKGCAVSIIVLRLLLGPNALVMEIVRKAVLWLFGKLKLPKVVGYAAEIVATLGFICLTGMATCERAGFVYLIEAVGGGAMTKAQEFDYICG